MVLCQGEVRSEKKKKKLCDLCPSPNLKTVDLSPNFQYLRECLYLKIGAIKEVVKVKGGC